MFHGLYCGQRPRSALLSVVSAGPAAGFFCDIYDTPLTDRFSSSICTDFPISADNVQTTIRRYFKQIEISVIGSTRFLKKTAWRMDGWMDHHKKVAACHVNRSLCSLCGTFLFLHILVRHLLLLPFNLF